MNPKKLAIFILVTVIFILFVSSSLAATKTFRVKETDFVKVKAEAIDLDGDNLNYSYAFPLDEKGEWQTNYGDAGEYEIEITASDGKEQVVRMVKIIVENINQAPYVSEKQINVKETQDIDLKKLVVDPDGDVLSYEFNAPFDNNGVWKTGYDDEGNYVATFQVSDGEHDTNARVEVNILRTNQPPIITDIFSKDSSLNAKEDTELDFYVDSVDNDGDLLTYTWTYDDEVISEENAGEFYLDYESSGEHILKLIINDTIKTIEKEWTIKINGVNRKPKLNFLPITVKEGEKVILDYPDVDLDKDDLIYSFESPLNEEGEWQTGYYDEGTYNLEVITTDGEFTVKEDVKITVTNVDQSPVLNLPESLEVKEGELLNVTIDSFDPDGDEVTLSFDYFPQGAKFKNDILTWTPSYDHIRRSGGLISDVLNSLRLEHLFLRSRTVPFKITSCAKELCTSKEISLTVYNVNRMPEFTQLNNLTIAELDKVKMSVEAVDPDGDIVRVYYTDPLRKKSGTWNTNYDDQGIYTVFVTATDGKWGNTQHLELEVLKKNREPSLKIKDDVLVVNEGQQFMFKVSATDPDGDDVTIRLDNVPPGASFVDGTFLWEPNHNTVMNRSQRSLDNLFSNFNFLNKRYNSERKTIWLSFVGNDGTSEVVHPVEVTVKNVNVAPEILDFMPVNEFSALVGQEIMFHITAKDMDNDRLTYDWDFGLNQGSVKGTDTVSRTFTSPGKKRITVKVDDGRDSVEREWVINTVAEPVILEEEEEEFDPFTVKVYVIE